MMDMQQSRLLSVWWLGVCWSFLACQGPSEPSPLPDAHPYGQVRSGLANAYHRFSEEKAGRVAFLGGSITQNPGWRDSLCQYLQRRFPETKFEFIPAGISSTGSTPGAFRLERDVLSKGHVDLLFEEAAVNDATNGRSPLEQLRGMEGIVRHARRSNPSMDIVLMHFVDPDKMEAYNKGETPGVIARHERVAEHYRLPSLNLALEVTERIAAGEFSWEEDFVDLHPSPFGQNLYFLSMRQFLEHAWRAAEGQGAEPHPLPAPLDPFSYSNARLVNLAAATLGTDWSLVPNWQPSDRANTRPGFVEVPMLEATEPGATLHLDFEGTAIGLFEIAGPDVGYLDYRVDGGEFKRLDQYTKWSHFLHLPWLYVLEAELPPGSHRLELRIPEQAHPESRGHACRIVHFAVNRAEGSEAAEPNGREP